MLASFLDMQKRRGPLGFVIGFVAVSVISVLSAEGINAALHHNHHLTGLIVFLAIIVAIFGLSALLTQAIRRLNDMGWNGMYSMLLVFPALSVTLFALGMAFQSPLTTTMFVLGLVVLVPLIAVPGKKPE